MGTEDIAGHLGVEYGIAVSGLAELDRDVFRVDRRDGPSLVARVFPASRPLAEIEGDAAILHFLGLHEFPSERWFPTHPVTSLDGRGVLVTEFATGHKPPPSGRTFRRLGILLGRLHTLPLAGPAARDGGAWHHLASGRPQAEVEAALALVDESASRLPRRQQPHYQALRAEVERIDAGDGLPDALIHPDFVPANVIASAAGDAVIVDWACAGRGPRLWSLAFLLWAAGASDLTLVDAVLDGYRTQVELEPDELARLGGMIGARPVIFECWRFGHGHKDLPAIAAGLPVTRELAAAIADQAIRSARSAQTATPASSSGHTGAAVDPAHSGTPAQPADPGVQPGAPAEAAGPGVQPGAPAEAAGPGVQPGAPAEAAGPGVQPGAPAEAAGPGVQPGAPAEAAGPGVQPGAPADSDGRYGDLVSPSLLEGVSGTALTIAAIRADESAQPGRLFDDPLAGVFVAASGWSPPPRLPDRRSVLLRFWVIARTVFLDELLATAVGDGCHQVVLLGAGLDSRAFRLPWPPGVRCFELDDAGLLAGKNLVLGAQGAQARCERIPVPCDFRTDWPGALLEAGFTTEQPAVWVAEGLMVYMTPAEVDGVLADLSTLSAPGSRLGMTLSGIGGGDGAQGRAPRVVTRRRSTAPEDPLRWLAGHGWAAELTTARDVLTAHGRLPAGHQQASPQQGAQARGLLIGAVKDEPRSRPRTPSRAKRRPARPPEPSVPASRPEPSAPASRPEPTASSTPASSTPAPAAPDPDR